MIVKYLYLLYLFFPYSFLLSLKNQEGDLYHKDIPYYLLRCKNFYNYSYVFDKTNDPENNFYLFTVLVDNIPEIILLVYSNASIFSKYLHDGLICTPISFRQMFLLVQFFSVLWTPAANFRTTSSPSSPSSPKLLFLRDFRVF